MMSPEQKMGNVLYRSCTEWDNQSQSIGACYYAGRVRTTLTVCSTVSDK